LPVVEEGVLTLFGATTENPKFAVNSTILSRSLVFETKALNEQDLINLIQRVKEYYKNKDVIIKIDKEAAKKLIIRCSGDARKMITALEAAVDILAIDGIVNEDVIDTVFPSKHVVFDKNGSAHFDNAHCYQDAIQDSDADGAIYWLAAWLNSGEDPAYICRRMLISAFEDCAGNPFAITSALAATLATERTGMPECMIAMAHATIEMANSKRNKSAFYAIHAAMADVQNNRTVHIPEKMRAGNNSYDRIVNKKYVKNFESDYNVFNDL
jgi:putative ATPase